MITRHGQADADLVGSSHFMILCSSGISKEAIMSEGEPIFSTDWFSYNTAFLRATFQNLAWNFDDQRVLIEIGSFEGRSTIWFAKNIFGNINSKIYCIDTFLGGIENSDYQKKDLYDRFTRNVMIAQLTDKIEVFRMESWKGLSELMFRGVESDLIYVDGSHQTPDVLEDAILSFRLLKTGGIMIFDDYTWSMEDHGNEDILNSPRFGIDIFINIYRRKVKIIGQSKNQICIRKI